MFYTEHGNLLKRGKVKYLKIVFVSNYFNHHQKPFCEELYHRLGNDFVFVSTSIMREERKKLGYSYNELPIYVILSHKGPLQRQKALTLINTADVVIVGSAPNDMIFERIRAGKLVLRYSERPYKKKPTLFKKLYCLIRFRQRDLWRKSIYMLCASAYTACDFTSAGMYKNCAYKWGYFPETKHYDIKNLLEEKKKTHILWCGRFLNWKHPDDVIRAAKKLRDEGYLFTLDFIGTGVMEEELQNIVNEYSLDNCVSFLGSMNPSEVRCHMEKAGIYLFTSDKQEGWGAVLNESMNSGCAVVASHAIGSVPFLLENNKNGLIYRSGDVDMLYEKIKYLLDNPSEQVRMGKAAYETITKLWNANVAAERAIKLSEKILSGDKHPNLYENGPCSRAEIIKDDWFLG